MTPFRKHLYVNILRSLIPAINKVFLFQSIYIVYIIENILCIQEILNIDMKY